MTRRKMWFSCSILAVQTAAVCLLLVGSFVSGALAQGGEKSTAVSAVRRLNRAPVNHQVLQVRLPRPVQRTLPNGLTVLILERHKLPTVSYALWIKTGALSDPANLPGLAKFTSEMLREGTTHRSSAQLASDVDDIGASLDASSDFGSNLSTVTASGLADNAPRLMELMSDMAQNPTFPNDELQKYRTRQLAELEQLRAEPGFLASERFHRDLYGNFPAAIVAPTPQSIRAVDVQRLKSFHDQYYVPNNAILGIAGDVRPDEVFALVTRYFGSWARRPLSPAALGAVPPPSPHRILLVNRPGSVQTNILAGDLSIQRRDPDFIPLTVVNRVFGGGPSARLFIDLREEKGYTYGAYSRFTADIYRGPFIANTEVRNAVTDGSMQALMDEFRRIRDQKIPENELDEARRSIVARFALSLEQPTTLLGYWLTTRYYGLPDDYWDRYPEQVARVNPDLAQQIARKYFDLDHLQVVCVGDGKQIRNVLAKYGPVEVYDADGKRLE